MINSDYKIPYELKGLKFYHHKERFYLESESYIDDLKIAYHSYGRLNSDKSNVIWVCHALTANSDPIDWWSGLFGEGKLFDPSKYFIICANIIGSCYGTTGPRSLNPVNGKTYGMNFPLVSVRDWANAHKILADHLGIDKINIAIGGSCGGHQVLEMCLIENLVIENAILLVTSAIESSWSIAIHEAQRMTLLSSDEIYKDEDNAADKMLASARGMGLINYRSFKQYIQSQSDTDDRLIDFKAASYIRYQGKKLSDRFYAQCYYHLLNTLDTHNLGRQRKSIESALSSIRSKCLIISIDSDLLIPVSEQKKLDTCIPNSTWNIINSDYGHDGFLVEATKIESCVVDFLSK